jgi:DNA-binding NarL/FixJ family response regulator
MLNILIADDHQLLREGFERVILRTNLSCYVEGVSNGKDAIEFCRKQKFDIVFMDVSMPEMNGIEATHYITKHFKEIKVIAMSQFDDKLTIQKMKDAGAVGYILKSESDINLKKYIKAALSGSTCFPKNLSKEFTLMPGIIERLNNTTIDKYKFSARELEVLLLITNGKSIPQIAEKLKLSTRTIEWHKGNLMQKLDVKNTLALIDFALKLGVNQM